MMRGWRIRAESRRAAIRAAEVKILEAYRAGEWTLSSAHHLLTCMHAHEEAAPADSLFACATLALSIGATLALAGHRAEYAGALWLTLASAAVYHRVQVGLERRRERALAVLTAEGPMKTRRLLAALGHPSVADRVLRGLERDGLVRRTQGEWPSHEITRPGVAHLGLDVLRDAENRRPELRGEVAP